jgi:hypothetical protein
MDALTLFLPREEQEHPKCAGKRLAQEMDKEIRDKLQKEKA